MRTRPVTMLKQMKPNPTYLAATLALALLAGVAAAQGLLIPVEPDLPPLALTRHHVGVEIDSQGSRTTVEQVFTNHTQRALEAQYVFPIPDGAVVSRFTMLVNGRETPGELIEKGEARRIYNSIVNRAQDPGLLEYLGKDLFRANVFPIAANGSQTITVRFDQVLPAQDSLVAYSYPVRSHPKRGPTVHGTFEVSGTIRSRSPILNVYSPSHSLAITRPDERTAEFSYSTKNETLEKDFQLYYSVSDSDIGLNLVTYRPDASQPGTFMMLVSPRSELQAERLIERDIVFVIDTSGSMIGEKMQQARKALAYCISSLNDGDRFNIVRFATDVESWKPDLAPAGENRQAALAYVEALFPQGGTNVAGAVDVATSFRDGSDRPYFVIFLTDGQPTLGDTTDPKEIVAKVKAAGASPGGESLRIFTWGVGYDVDTHLLDGIAGAARGLSEYVRPDEDIAVKLAAFYNHASHPVLTDLELTVQGDRIQVLDVRPRRLPDLYAGGQVVLLGRYTGSGHAALQLTGKVGGRQETFTFEGEFPASASGHEFVESLWAQRQIGYLLDAIRLNGESPELVNDVVRLSKEFGIQTPYTSYLILEDMAPTTTAARDRAGARDGRAWWARRSQADGARAAEAAEGRRLFQLEEKLDLLVESDAEAGDKSSGARLAAAAAESPAAPARELARSLEDGFARKDGKAAVETATYLRRLKEAERVGGEGQLARAERAAGTRLFLYRDLWVDERFEASDQVTAVRFGSTAYFRILELHPELLDALKLGTAVVYRTGPGHALVIGASGQESLSDTQIEAMFR